MAIQGVETKCYILALFVRDDDERFLLGSGHYEFKDSQKQFSANTIQNDVVEVQGNDGFLLAGQVRRPGTQSFDGYIGDGTTEKTEVEEYRRQFFGFFRKNHFYRVIYVFPDGSAIQRKRGFLVDDATVQELYQQYPEYHVALNFEDVNYYTYSENEQGEEIYAEEAQIDLSSMVATGGLVWDEYGAVNEGYAWGGEMTASGTEFTVQNDLSLPAPITDTRLNGDTYQQTYSGKNLFNPDSPITSQISNVIVTKTALDNGVRLTATTVPSNANDYAGAVFIIGEVSDYVGKTISFSSTAIPSGGNKSRCYIGTCNASGGSRSVKASSGNETGTYNYELSWTVASDSNQYICIVLYEAISSTITVGDYVDFTNAQIEIGSTTTYEPYVGGVPAPNPDYPQQIQTVTGEQTVSISDGNGNTQAYSISLGSTELCKIGDYQDYIYKGADGWYVHKAISKVTFDGTENWTRANTLTSDKYKMGYNDLSGLYVHPSISTETMLGYSSHFGARTEQQLNNLMDGFSGNTAGTKIFIYNSEHNTTAGDFKTWLSSNNVTLYYALVTTTDTKITDTTLISQLNALGSAKLMVGENNVLVSATGTNLPAELQIKYYSTVSFEGAGFVWDEGGSGGPTTVQIDSITNVYPIWTVKGPAVNPELSVITTNTTLKYEGSVGANQTLVIDMMNKTAKLNGTSVIGNVTGDWVNFTPGINRVVYITDNADTPPSLIEWQEVVG